MDPVSLSALSALAGSAIGGATSLATSWMTQHAQGRSQTLAQEIAGREALYGRFIDEASRLLADALVNQRESSDDLVVLHALINRMRLTSSSAVIEQAEDALGHVIDTYLAPNKNLRELRTILAEGQAPDPLRGFGQACRSELRGLTSLRRGGSG